eukprot:6188584-Pyramimonas_sp.AAC.1
MSALESKLQGRAERSGVPGQEAGPWALLYRSLMSPLLFWASWLEPRRSRPIAARGIVGWLAGDTG